MQNSVIRIENLGKIYKRSLKEEFNALKNLTMEVERGEVFGFLGPNGAGKTTTIKVLVNLIYPSSGHAWILNKSCLDPGSRKHIGYLPEMISLYDFLTLEEVLDFAGHFYGMSSTTIKAKTKELASILDLERAKKMQLRKYSKGMLQRAGLAYALMGDPDVLILDEPMSGLDPIGRKDFVDLIKLLRNQGKTIFFSSHVLSDIESLCDRVGILVQGELKKVGKVSDMLHESSDGFIVRVPEGNQSTISQFEEIGALVRFDGDVLNINIPKNKLEDTMKMIKSLNVSIISIDTARKTLEDIFLEVVKKKDTYN